MTVCATCIYTYYHKCYKPWHQFSPETSPQVAMVLEERAKWQREPELLSLIQREAVYTKSSTPEALSQFATCTLSRWQTQIRPWNDSEREQSVDGCCYFINCPDMDVKIKKKHTNTVAMHTAHIRHSALGDSRGSAPTANHRCLRDIYKMTTIM